MDNVSPGFGCCHHVQSCDINFDSPYVFSSCLCCTTKKGETEKPLCITCVNTNQGSDSETSSPYLDALHRILRVGYLFHVSALDSFDTNPLQVDLAI